MENAKVTVLGRITSAELKEKLTIKFHIRMQGVLFLADTNVLIQTSTQVLVGANKFPKKSDSSKSTELLCEIESIFHWYHVWSVSHANLSG